MFNTFCIKTLPSIYYIFLFSVLYIFFVNISFFIIYPPICARFMYFSIRFILNNIIKHICFKLCIARKANGFPMKNILDNIIKISDRFIVHFMIEKFNHFLFPFLLILEFLSIICGF